jgi:hypothetical protein
MTHTAMRATPVSAGMRAINALGELLSRDAYMTKWEALSAPSA